MAKTSIEEFKTTIEEALFNGDNSEEIQDISDYRTAGLLTLDAGLVIKRKDGSVFYLTVKEGR